MRHDRIVAAPAGGAARAPCRRLRFIRASRAIGEVVLAVCLAAAALAVPLIVMRAGFVAAAGLLGL